MIVKQARFFVKAKIVKRKFCKTKDANSVKGSQKRLFLLKDCEIYPISAKGSPKRHKFCQNTIGKRNFIKGGGKMRIMRMNMFSYGEEEVWVILNIFSPGQILHLHLCMQLIWKY